MKKYFQDYAFLLILAGAIVALDQFTKNLVRANLDFMEVWVPWEWLEPYARIVHWKNTGAAFGMFQDFGGVFTVLSIIVSIAILYYFPQVPRRDWALRIAMVLQLGGAVGNLIDRLTQGWVTDFVSVGNFAVFNVADASISTGVAVLIVGMWLKERQERASAAQEAAEQEAAERANDERSNAARMDAALLPDPPDSALDNPDPGSNSHSTATLPEEMQRE